MSKWIILNIIINLIFLIKIISCQNCCMQSNGMSLGESCNCLPDNFPINSSAIKHQHTNRPIEKIDKWHWKMQNYSFIENGNMMEEDIRPSLTISLSQCNQINCFLYVTPLKSSWPTSQTALWSSDNKGEVNELIAPLTFEDFFISVNCSDMEAAFYEIAAYLPDATIPVVSHHDSKKIIVVPTISDDIIEFGDLMSMTVLFTIEDNKSMRDLQYEVYYSRKVDNIFMKSVCGIEMRATQAAVISIDGDFFIEASSDSRNSLKRSVVIVGLEQNVDYIFNVIVRDVQSGLAIPYTGAEGTPTYHRVVASQSSESTVVVTVIILIIIGFFSLGILYSKIKIKKSYYKVI